LRRHELSQGSASHGRLLADGPVPIVASPRSVNLVQGWRGGLASGFNMTSPRGVSKSPLDQAFERAEGALLRIERSVERGAMHKGRDDLLRGKVANVIAELDELIRAAGGKG